MWKIVPAGKALCSGACGSDTAVFFENYGVLGDYLLKQIKQQIYIFYFRFQCRIYCKDLENVLPSLSYKTASKVTVNISFSECLKLNESSF